MKKAIFFLSISLALITGCSNLNDLNLKSIAYDEAYELSVNTISKTADNRYLIKFDSVMFDSRCPKDVVCVWEGVAGVRFNITDSSLGNQLQTVELHTLNSGTWSSHATVNGLKISLLELNPYPLTSSSTNYKKYKATILLTKIN